MTFSETGLVGVGRDKGGPTGAAKPQDLVIISPLRLPRANDHDLTLSDAEPFDLDDP